MTDSNTIEFEIAVDKHDRSYCSTVCPQIRFEYCGGDCYYCHCKYYGQLGWYPGPKRPKECLALTNEERLWKDEKKKSTKTKTIAKAKDRTKVKETSKDEKQSKPRKNKKS